TVNLGNGSSSVFAKADAQTVNGETVRAVTLEFGAGHSASNIITLTGDTNTGIGSDNAELFLRGASGSNYNINLNGSYTYDIHLQQGNMSLNAVTALTSVALFADSGNHMVNFNNSYHNEFFALSGNHTVISGNGNDYFYATSGSQNFQGNGG